MSDRRTILVTGASSGIGAAVALAAAAEGWDVVLTGRDADRLHLTGAGCASHGAHSVTAIRADLDSPWKAAGTIAAAAADAGLRLDSIVNAAGVAAFQSIEATDPTHFDRTMRINAIGPAAIIARNWPDLVAGGRGRIVNISSMSSVDPYRHLFAYGASKAAMDNLTRSSAGDGASVGVKAWSILPGVVETPMLRTLFSLEQVPAHRAYQPESIARLAIDLIADRRTEPSGTLIELRADP